MHTTRDTGGLSRDRIRRVHDLVQRHVETGPAPGLVTLVARRGREYADVVGTQAADRATPMRRDSIFRLASMTKPVTAVATMILLEECKLHLDDLAETWLPELANRKVLRTPASPLDDVVPANRAITVRDLLTFRCGYGEVAFLAGLCPMQRALAEARLPLSEWIFQGAPDDFMRRLGALPLVSQPGERWLYHMSAEILGVLVARVTGRSLGAFLRDRIFEPLGMKDTGFHVPTTKLDRFATLYATNPATGARIVADDSLASTFSHPPAFESGAGGLVSTADDMLAFARMLLHKGTYRGHRILARPTVELMTSPQLTDEQKALSPFFPRFWETSSWGLGIGITTRRNDLGRSVGSFGWDGACTTSMWIDPREDLVGILMSQHLPSWMDMKIPAIIGDFWTSTYQAIDD